MTFLGRFNEIIGVLEDASKISSMGNKVPKREPRDMGEGFIINHITLETKLLNNVVNLEGIPIKTLP